MANDREELLKRARTATILPMLSGMMNETFRIMADPDSSFGQLYDVVKYDQAISSKIISIANSPYYNRGTPVVSLERAMVMVGFKEIERIIMCLVFMKQIMTPWRLGQDDLAAIWEHSLLVAHAAKTLSAKTSLEESEKAFAISIVHDIGKIIFYTYDSEYRSLATEAALGSRDVCDLERARYETDHQEIGHLMSVKWGFPGEFSEAVKDHHSPPDGRVPVIDVLREADAFACGSGRYLPESERIILQNEKDLIGTETERIRRLVGI
jgi:putative nucleotidyltransferase with HDIG domain